MLKLKVPCISSILYVLYLLSISMVECQLQPRLQPREQENYQPLQQGDYQPPQQGDYQPPQQGDYHPPQQGTYQSLTKQKLYEQGPPNNNGGNTNYGGNNGGKNKNVGNTNYGGMDPNVDDIDNLRDILGEFRSSLGLLDYKALLSGRVRPGLVARVCDRTAKLVTNVGEARFNELLEDATSFITTTVDERCKGLIPEIKDRCNDIIAEVIDRYNGAIQEFLPELEEMCDDNKKEATVQVRNAVDTTFQMVFEVEKDKANVTYQKMVAEGRLQAEQMFAEGLSKGRAQAEELLAANVTEGRKMADQEFRKRFVVQFEKDGRIRAENDFQKAVAEGETKGQKMFDERAKKGTDTAEEACGRSIRLICNHVEPDSNSADFCAKYRNVCVAKFVDLAV